MFNKRKQVLILTLIFCMFFGASIFSLNTPEILQTSRNNDIDESLKISANNDTIIIDGNKIFADKASSEGWDGNGNYGNPYIIENYNISAVFDQHGIEIQNTNCYFIIRNVTVSNGRSNYKRGFYFNNVTNGELINNTADNNIAGFLFKNCSKNTLEGNKATNNRHGLSLESSYNNTLTGNEVTNNTYLGFYLGSSNNNILTENIATGNLNGFTLSSSNYTTLTNNTANNNQHGFSLWHSNNNILTNNTANNNSKYGIYLEESNLNEISGNILEDNGLGSIYEKFTDDADYPDVFLIAAIIFIIALLSIILIKLVFFIKRKNIKFVIPKLSLKKRKE